MSNMTNDNEHAAFSANLVKKTTTTTTTTFTSRAFQRW